MEEFYGSADLRTLVNKKTKVKFENMYVGTNFNDKEIQNELKKQKKIEFIK